MKKFGWLCLLLTLPYLIKAQVSSIGSGDWNTPGNWSCTCIPGPGNGTVTISPFDIITLSSGAQQVDALVVDSDATLNLNGGTMVVTGSIDVVVGDGFSTFDGFLNIGSGGSLEGRSTFTSSAGNTQIDGFYIHNQNGGAIPDASWNSGSTLEVRGVTTTAPTNFGQSFYNLRWNSTHTAAISLGAQLTTILNDLTIVSTGSTRALNLSTNTNGTLNITGDLFIQGSSLFGVVGTGSYTLNIGQNLEISSTLTNSFLLTGSGSPVVNVTGNFIKSGTGTVNFASSTLAAGASALNISGNFTMSAGTLTETGIGNGTVNFVGSGTHIFSKTGGSISNTVNFTNASTSTLDLGTSILEGGGAFTNNGTIQLGSVHASGALQNTATLDADCGNIITPFATRTFAANSTIIYNGSAIQAIGDGFPSSGGDVNLTINNSNNVNLSDNLEIVALRTLTLTSGNIVIGNKTLTINGTISGSGGIVGGATSNMVIGGTGNFGTLTFAGTNQLLNFTINRTSSGLVTLGGNLTILGTFTQTAGDIALNGFNLSIQGNFARTAGNITVNSASTLAFEGAGTLPTSVGLSGTTLSTLTLDRSGATLTSGASITVTNLNLLDGTFANGAGFAIASGGTITRNAGVINTSPTSTGTYNIFYNVSGTISSGNELPAVTTRIQNVTIDGGGDVNLSASRTINGNLTLTSGDFNIGSNTVTLEGNLVANTSSTFTSGTFIFDGNTTISGSAVPTFGNIILTDTRTLTLPSGDFEVAGNITFEAGSTLNAGSSTLVLNGSGLQTFSAGGNTLTNVTVNKTGGSDVDLTSQLIITGALEVSSANSDFGSNGNLVIRSTSDGASNNGRIGQLLNGASVSGDVVVERFMASEGRIYRYISAPVSGFTVASLQLDFPVTGTFTGTSSCTGCTTSQSMFSYNGATQTYVDFPADANTETLQAGIGYSAFIRQNVLGGPVTIDWTGPINQGSQSLAVSYNGTTSSWNLVGNPYPSTIDWDNTGWTKTNISGAISVRDNATGIYQTWNGSTGGLTGGRIATGQAFWARATGASPSLQVTETVKSSTTGAFFREAEIELDQFVLTLFDGIVEDHAYYWVSGDASNAVDDLDAPKLNNFRNTGSVPLIDLATYSHGDGSIPMAINSVNSLNCAEAIRIYTNDLDVGTYTLSLETFGSIKNMTWTLKDKFLNTEINFNENPSYEFTVTSDPNSKAVERFELIGVTGQTATLESSTVCKQGSSTLTATNIPAGANVNWYETATEGLVLGTGSSFMTPDLTSNKTYYAAVSNGGCEGSRVAVEAIVVKYDDVVITSDGNTLMSSYANGNQWLLNNVEIPGATGQSYEATESGLYSLVVAVGECQTSAEVQFAVTSAEDPFARLVNIYPNPTVDKFKLEIVSAGPVITKLFDAMGSLVNEKLLDGDSATKSAEFDLTGNSSGLYILRIQKGTSVHQVKIIKRK